MAEATRHVQVRLDPELAEWFDANCPAFSKQRFVEQCFVMLRLAVELGHVPHPNVFSAKAALMAVETLTPSEGPDGSIPVRTSTDQA